MWKRNGEIMNYIGKIIILNSRDVLFIFCSQAVAKEGKGPAEGLPGCKTNVWMPSNTTDPGFWEGDNSAEFQMQSMDDCAAICYKKYQSLVFGFITGSCRCGTVKLGDIDAAVTKYTGPGCGGTNAQHTDCIKNKPCAAGGWCTCPVREVDKATVL